MTSIIKRTNHMEKQWHICQRDTMRFERFNQEDNGKARIHGSIETL